MSNILRLRDPRALRGWIAAFGLRQSDVDAAALSAGADDAEVPDGFEELDGIES